MILNASALHYVLMSASVNADVFLVGLNDLVVE